MNSFVCVANFKWPSQSFYIFYIQQTVHWTIVQSSLFILWCAGAPPPSSKTTVTVQAICFSLMFSPEFGVSSLHLPGDTKSLRLWHPASRRGRCTSWCRCLLDDTLGRREKKFALFLLWTADIGFRGETVRWLTGDAFLQALVEATQANLVQQTGVEPLEGLHIFQTCHNYVNIFPRALRWSGGINRRGQCTECS